METEIKPLPSFFISQNIGDERISQFLNGKYIQLSTSLGRPDTRSIWYSRNHIAALLDEIDHAGGDGLRIFFATYELENSELAGQLGLAMNPTRPNANGGHDDVILENEPDFTDRSALTKSLSLRPADGDWFNNKLFNYGSPCPPLCDR